MAGTVTISRTLKRMGLAGKTKKTIEVVDIDWVADAADGSVPNTSIALFGRVLKAVTNPGSTAPTANYDIALGDPEDSALDALSTALNNRHTTNSEQAYPAIAGAPGTVVAFQPFLAGTYTFQLTNNSVNSATGRCRLYLLNGEE